MKTKINQPPILPQSASNEQSLPPQQLWQHLKQKQQQALLQSISQICWQLVQATAPQRQEVRHEQ